MYINLTEKPTLDMKKAKDIDVKAGNPFKIEIPCTGFPVPDATWELNGKPLTPDDRKNMEVLILLY